MKIRRFLDSKFYIPFVFIISFVSWFLSYISRKGIIDSNLIDFIEYCELIGYGSISLLFLINFKNTYYFIPLFIFIPFMFARPFDAIDIPYCVIIGGVLVAIGLILNYFIYKPKLMFGKFLLGLIVLGIAIILSGIGYKSDNYFIQLIFSFCCVGAFILLYVSISSSASVDFHNIARLFLYLGLFLSLQLIVYYCVQDNILDSFLSKDSNVGWGISNNIALMLLFTMPFALYLATQNRRVLCVLYLLTFILELLCIVFTYSRGAVVAMIIGIIIMIPFIIIEVVNKKTFYISLSTILCFICLFVLIFCFSHKTEAARIFEILTSLDIHNGNGRYEIYKKCLQNLKEYKIFGKGIFSQFNGDNYGNTSYVWGHSTITQTASTMGGFGLLSIFFHFGQKYYVLLKNATNYKMIIFYSFFISGLYGLVDISYYFVNYMIPLVIVMALLEKLMKADSERI